MHANSDAEVAQRLTSMELTERLSTARLPTLQALLKGKKSQRLLIALADRQSSWLSQRMKFHLRHLRTRPRNV